MKYDEIRHAWNTQTDDWSGWYYGLSEYEKVEWAARFGAATERATRQKAQEEVVFLKERIARAGVEPREACAKVCDEFGDKMGGSVGAYDCAAAIRARNT